MSSEGRARAGREETWAHGGSLERRGFVRGGRQSGERRKVSARERFQEKVVIDEEVDSWLTVCAGRARVCAVRAGRPLERVRDTRETRVASAQAMEKGKGEGKRQGAAM